MLKDRKRVGWTVKILIATWDTIYDDLKYKLFMHDVMMTTC